jgi:endogenous inhibitor of DNA gyrase (YacG/DUF329 family)
MSRLLTFLCPHCGKKLRGREGSDKAKCPNCGNDVQPADYAAAEVKPAGPPSPQHAGPRKVLMIAATANAFALFAFASGSTGSAILFAGVATVCGVLAVVFHFQEENRSAEHYRLALQLQEANKTLSEQYKAMQATFDDNLKERRRELEREAESRFAALDDEESRIAEQRVYVDTYKEEVDAILRAIA